MKYQEGAVMEALQRAQVFLPEYLEELVAASPADFARAQQKLDEVLTRLMTFGVDQDGGNRGALGETAKQRQLRIDLVKEWLQPIAAIARRWAKGNEALLRRWEAARHIRRRPGPVSVTAASALSTGTEAAPPTERPLSMA